MTAAPSRDRAAVPVVKLETTLDVSNLKADISSGGGSRAMEGAVPGSFGSRESTDGRDDVRASWGDACAGSAGLCPVQSKARV